MRSTRSLVLATVIATAIAPPAAAAPKALILAADPNAGPALAKSVGALNQFAQVDFLDGTRMAPTLQALKVYDAVLVFSGAAFLDPKGTGDSLADYVDAGGGVVLAPLADAFSAQFQIAGRFAGDGYFCLLPSQNPPVPKLTPMNPQPNDPKSPLVAGVGGVSSQLRDTPGTLNMANGASSVWDYVDMVPAICKMSIKGHPRVDLNFYPSVPGGGSLSEVMLGDEARLVANALLYVANGGNPLRGAPNPAKFADTGTFASSLPTTLTYTNTSMVAATVTGATLTGMNPGDFTITSHPQFPVVVAPNGTLTVVVAFSPLSAGARSASLSLGVAGQMSSADVLLQGTAILSNLAVSPSPIGFGGSQIGVPLKKDVTVTNKGAAKIAVQSLAVTIGQAAYVLSNLPNLPVALNPGTSFTFTITFTPQMNGLSPGAVALTSNDPNSPMMNLALSGYAGPPALSLDAGSIAFGGVNLGATSDPSDVQITNSGFSDLKVTDLQLSGPNAAEFVLDKKAAIGTLPVMQSTPFAVSFKPAQVGARSATLTVVTNAGNQTVALQGTGTTATMKLAPGALAFGSQHVGVAAMPQNLTVSNMGTGILRIRMLGLSGAGAAAYSLAGPGGMDKPFTVGPNASGTIAVGCTPTAVGPAPATLTVVSDVSMAQVALTCTGVAPLIAVTPGSLDFGVVSVGDTPMPMTLTVKNKGTDALNVLNVTVVGRALADYSTDQLMLGPIAPGGSAALQVSFMPSMGGARTAELDLMSDDPKTPLVRVTVQGTALQPAYATMPDPGTALDFGMVQVNSTSAAIPIQIQNTGDGPITITSLGFDGAMAGEFTHDAKLPRSIDAGASAKVNLHFAPTMSGMAGTMLTINVQGLSPTAYMLVGVAVAPAVAVSPMVMDFGPIAVGMSSAPRDATITNGGKTPVTISGITSNNPSFSFDSPSDPKIAPSGSATFHVTFTPDAAAMKTGTIFVAIQGQQKPVAAVQVSGLGVMPATRDRGGCSLGGRAPGAPLRGGIARGLASLALAFILAAARRRRR